jgi:hypothetical protein
MIARLGKPLEAAVRLIRPFLLPSYRHAFAALLARGMSERREGEPIVCCDFSNPAIDAVGGRYYFSLVRDLIDAGYFPVFTARRSTLSTFGTSALKSLLLPERLGVIQTPDDLTEPYFLITDDADAIPEHAERIVVVDYEWRVCRKPEEFAFPFFVHPWIASGMKSLLPPEAGKSRPARLFFGGNTEHRKYDKDVIRDIYRMLSRREMLTVTTAAIPAGDVYKPTTATEWLASPEFHPFVFCETQNCMIPQDRWLEALAKADFFLACPGVGMPLCHNVIEALAAGSIPILQYAAYLSPPLEDRVNCLAFHDAQSLDDVMRSIFTMSEAEITALRANVRAHYDKHLAPGRFAKRLLSGRQNRRVLRVNDYRVPRQ